MIRSIQDEDGRRLSTHSVRCVATDGTVAGCRTSEPDAGRWALWIRLFHGRMAPACRELSVPFCWTATVTCRSSRSSPDAHGAARYGRRGTVKIPRMSGSSDPDWTN